MKTAKAAAAWTDAMLAALQHTINLRTSESADFINRTCGTAITRMAVIGKRSRLRPRTEAEKAVERQRQRMRKRRRKLIGNKPDEARHINPPPKSEVAASPRIHKTETSAAPVAAIHESPPVLNKDGLPYTHATLPFGRCRWTINGEEKPFRVCGNPGVGKYGSSCAYHAARSVDRKRVAE